MDIQTQINEILAQIKSETNAKLKIAMLTLSEIIQTAIDKNFDAYGRTNGSSDIFDGGTQTWKPISKSYKELLVKRNITPLVATLERSGKLRQSIRIKTYSTKITLSVDPRIPYASVHQFGAKMEGTFAVPEHKRKITQAFGKKITSKTVTVKAHNRTVNYTIPARPFIQLNQEDIDDIKDYLMNYL